ncbi:hypothetical protein [Helicobacter saguini]|nr:hypothetical protein [Helicobacter saguini]
MSILSKILKGFVIFGLIFSFYACGYKQDPYWDSTDKKQSDVLFE